MIVTLFRHLCLNGLFIMMNKINGFIKVKPSMIENIIIEVIDAEQGIYMIGKE